MVNARLCETARQAFFFASSRHSNFLNFETGTLKCFECQCETFRLFNSSPKIWLRAKMSLYHLLAHFFELAGTGNSILAHYVRISCRTKQLIVWHQNRCFGCFVAFCGIKTS